MTGRLPREDFGMHTFPADDGWISEVERGRRCEAVVSLPSGDPPVVGDTVLFALSASRAGGPPSYIKGGDSILVSLTRVTPLGATDPDTGQALVQLGWEPLGQAVPTPAPGRAAKPKRPHRMA
jgi:hypothetical protein